MPKITIDDKEFLANDGETILQVAQRNGIYIPRFCYHPSLSIAGNCRMCLVEVEKMPKLQTACSTIVNEGMIVRTKTEKVKKARQDVLEFLLINHPLDCPICDKAGECMLQDNYMDHGLKKSRMKDEKNKKQKRRDLGSTIILDNERCILCTRCVRFLEEVTKTEELFINKRGDHSYIDIKPNTKLENDYSLNLVDICPVGALTSKDFRFKQRVWFLNTTESICLGCATGCKIKVQHNENRIYRIIPNPNEQTNTWLCDYGRMTYKITNSEKRLKKIILEGEEFSENKKYFSKIFDYLNNYIETNSKEKIAIVLSSYLSLEDNLALYQFAKNLEIKNIFSENLIEQKIKDGILKNTDESPNLKGLNFLKTIKKDIKNLNEMNKDNFDFIIAFENEALKYFSKHNGIFFAFNKINKENLIPIKNYFETEGSFINWQNYLGKTNKSIEAPKEIFSLLETIQMLSSYFFKGINIEEIKKDIKIAINR